MKSQKHIPGNIYWNNYINIGEKRKEGKRGIGRGREKEWKDGGGGGAGGEVKNDNDDDDDDDDDDWLNLDLFVVLSCSLW